MDYEWKETLKAEVHFLGSQFSEQMRNELDEVYRKAEVFDAIWSHYDRYYEDEDRPVMEQFGDEVADILNEYDQKCEEDDQ